MSFAAQGLTYDNFLHRETEQVDGNSCLTLGTVKARQILDPLSIEEEGEGKEKRYYSKFILNITQYKSA